MVIPDLSREQHLWQQGVTRVAGVDECGRGAWCCAVVSCAVILQPDRDYPELIGVRDSKTMTPLARERLATTIRQVAVAVGIGAASPREIERLNIRRATALSMRRALSHLGGYDHILIDGYAMPELGLHRQTSLIRGDANCLSIACASVVAKHCRDTLMKRLHPRYPDFQWDCNKGYGTARHFDMLQSQGPTAHHRRTFEPVRRQNDLFSLLSPIDPDVLDQ